MPAKKLESSEEIEKRALAKEVTEDEDFSTFIINAVTDGIHAFDRDLNYVIWNPGMEKITGKSAKEVLGKRAFDVFPYLLQNGREKHYLGTLQGESSVALEAPIVHSPSGSTRYVKSTYKPLRDEMGTIVGGLAIVRDSTDQHHIMKELKKLKEHLSQVIKDGEF